MCNCQFQAPYSTIPLSEFYSGFPTQQIPLCNVLLFVIVFSAPWNQAAAAAAVSSERVPLLGFEWFRGFCACRRPHRPSSCRPPFVPFPSLLVAVSSSRLVKKKHCRFLRRVHFSCAVFLFLNVFFLFFFLLWGKWREGKGRRELNSVMRNC